MNKQTQWLFETPYVPATSYSHQSSSISSEFEYESNPVIDPRIDVRAQRALMTMLSSNQTARAIAAMLIRQVKSGELTGLYQEDQRVPAMLARNAGKGWWQLLSPQKNSQVISDPLRSLAPCTFIFRRNLSRSLLIQELRQKFGDFSYVCFPP